MITSNYGHDACHDVCFYTYHARYRDLCHHRHHRHHRRRHSNVGRYKLHWLHSRLALRQLVLVYNDLDHALLLLNIGDRYIRN